MMRALEAEESRRLDGHRTVQQSRGRRVERFPAVAINAEQFAAGAVFPDERIERTIQKTAIGLIGDPVPVRLDLACDGPEGLVMTEAETRSMRRLVKEADALFGTRHFRH